MRVNPAIRGHAIQFAVADVAPSTEPLPAIPVSTAIERTLRRHPMICPRATREVAEAADFHPLIAAAVLAFKQHYPLVLSPDMIWLTILQGVAQHVQNHAAKL